MLLAYDQGYSRSKWHFDPIWPKGSNFQGQREIVRLLPWTLYISDFLNQAPEKILTSSITLHMTWNGFTLCIFPISKLIFCNRTSHTHSSNYRFNRSVISSRAPWNSLTVFKGIQEQFTLQLVYSCCDEYEIFGHKISVLELEIYKM